MGEKVECVYCRHVTEDSPAQIVQRLFPLLAEEKLTEAAGLFADSVSFSIPHPPGVPWVPEVDSAEGMRTFFELLRTHVQPKEFDLRQVISDGGDAHYVVCSSCPGAWLAQALHKWCISGAFATFWRAKHNIVASHAGTANRIRSRRT